ncbi:GNAT family N-acetyltransferase [Bacillus daqingensis]|uniref:GNAT family N-acetyltransferase n=1 Tax=Bacillus daqingensis TaxID=872396 RepID=A0ABV9NT34_9BACI
MITLHRLQKENWPQAAAVYKAGMDNGDATFETEVADWETWNHSHHAFARIAACWNGTFAGWAALSPVSPRLVYAGVAEVSVYVDPDFSGKGIGSSLLKEIEREGAVNGIWTLQSVIFSSNKGSLHVHQKSGFRTVGYRERIAVRDGVWHDTVLMEKRLPDQPAQKEVHDEIQHNHV